MNRLPPKLPTAGYSGPERRVPRIDLSPYEDLEGSGDFMVIAVDSTGLKDYRAGGWVERKHGKKKRYVKIHYAVNVETKEALAMMVTTDTTHDSRVFPKLLRKAESHGRISKIYGYGAFDGLEAYELLESKGIEAIT